MKEKIKKIEEKITYQPKGEQIGPDVGYEDDGADTKKYQPKSKIYSARKRIFNYIDRHIIWVLIATLLIWFGGWYTSAFPPIALLFLGLGFYFLIIRNFKEKMGSATFSGLTGFIHKKFVKFILFIFLFFALAGIAKLTALFILWTFVWLSKGVNMDIADELIRDNQIVHALTDIFISIPVMVILIILYLRYLKRNQENQA